MLLLKEYLVVNVLNARSVTLFSKYSLHPKTKKVAFRAVQKKKKVKEDIEILLSKTLHTWKLWKGQI